MVKEGCCPLCPSVKQAWPHSSADKWCLLRACLMSNEVFLLIPCMYSDMRHSQGRAWSVGLVKPITLMLYFWLKVCQDEAQHFSLPSGSIGTGWHFSRTQPYSLVMVRLHHLVLQVLRDNHLHECLHRLCLKGRSLYKHCDDNTAPSGHMSSSFHDLHSRMPDLPHLPASNNLCRRCQIAVREMLVLRRWLCARAVTSSRDTVSCISD